MNPQDPAVRQYLALTLEYHRLRGLYPPDEQAVEAAEDKMTLLWDTITDSYAQEFVQGACADINWALRGGRSAVRARPRSEVKPGEIDDFRNAKEAEDWPRVLECLRSVAPAFNPSQVATWRMLAYKAMGYPDVAAAFARLSGVG